MSNKWSSMKKNLLMEKSNGKCEICKKAISYTDENNKAHIDHIIPKSLGGKNAIENLRLLCVSCNCRRKNRTGKELMDLTIKLLKTGDLEKYGDLIKNELEIGLFDLKYVDEIESLIDFMYGKNKQILDNIRRKTNVS